MKLLEEILYYLWVFSNWVHKVYLHRIRGYKMDFYCQSQIEGRTWCKTQCDHCKEYYKPIEKNYKTKN